MDRNDFPVVPVELTTLVALRKESVDRNTYDGLIASANFWSLSARRAWIEIFIGPLIFSVQPVALRKESVDRNYSAARF